MYATKNVKCKNIQIHKYKYFMSDFSNNFNKYIVDNIVGEINMLSVLN